MSVPRPGTGAGQDPRLPKPRSWWCMPSLRLALEPRSDFLRPSPASCPAVSAARDGAAPAGTRALEPGKPIFSEHHCITLNSESGDKISLPPPQPHLHVCRRGGKRNPFSRPEQAPDLFAPMSPVTHPMASRPCIPCKRHLTGAVEVCQACSQQRQVHPANAIPSTVVAATQSASQAGWRRGGEGWAGGCGEGRETREGWSPSEGTPAAPSHAAQKPERSKAGGGVRGGV